jgi:phosphatidate cytidylyltransferase
MPEVSSMLRQRVMTALVLVAAFLATLLLALFPVQAIIFGAIASAGAWEWSNLVVIRAPLARVAFASLVPVTCVFLWIKLDLAGNGPVLAGQPLLAGSAFLWSAMLVGLKYYPGGGWLRGQPWIRGLMGWLMLSATWFAVVFCLRFNHGPTVLFLMILTIAAADIGAYFVGRRFGQHALAQAISPGKTWEGFWGGLTCVALLTALVWANLPIAYIHLNLGSLLVLGLATAGASVVGDLTLSLLKRQVGLKDSGSLLPGHGGLLDRLDSICGAAPIFALGLLLVGY